jgi:hypothetical protein
MTSSLMMAGIDRLAAADLLEVAHLRVAQSRRVDPVHDDVAQVAQASWPPAIASARSSVVSAQRIYAGFGDGASSVTRWFVYS